MRVGSVLLLGAVVQGIVYRFNPQWGLQQPWIMAFLMHATAISLACAAYFLYTRSRIHSGC